MLKLLARLRLSVLYAFARPLYWIVYGVWRYRRSVVRGNLARAFPEWDTDRRGEVERQFYRQAADLFAEIIAARNMPADELLDRVHITNPELLEETVAEGSALLLAGHQCNWEWLLLACCRRFDLPFDAVYKPLSVRSVDEFIAGVRTRFGARPIPKNDALIEIMRRRGERRVFCMVADQSPDPSKERYWTTFLGQESAFPVGPQMLAHYTKYPVLFVGMRRVKRGRYEVWFEKLGDPPHPKTSFELTDRYINSLQTMVHSQPEAWLWTNRKWKYPRPLHET